MFTNMVSAGTKALGGARFSLVSILPGTILAAVVLASIRSGAYGSGVASLQRIISMSAELSAGGTVLLVFMLFLAGVLLQPFQVALVQHLEGYWDRGPMRPFRTIAVEGHRRRLRSAKIQETNLTAPNATASTFRAVADLARANARAGRVIARARAIIDRYPTEIDQVMPTMLGNILRNAEDAAGDRYGLDATTLYPRMYPSVSKPLLDAIARQLDIIALTASLCVSFLVSAVATLPILARLDLWSMIPVALLILGAVSYRGAMQAAEGHGVLFATSFDLHRFDLLRALHHALPSTVQDEQALYQVLTAFLQGRQPPDDAMAAHHYDHSIYEKSPSPLSSCLPEVGEEASRNKGTEGVDVATPRPDEPVEPPRPAGPAR